MKGEVRRWPGFRRRQIGNPEERKSLSSISTLAEIRHTGMTEVFFLALRALCCIENSAAPHSHRLAWMIEGGTLLVTFGYFSKQF